FPDYVLDLDRIVQGLGTKTMKLIGHSMGGTISFLYTGSFPQRVARLVLIEGIGPPSMAFADAPARMEKWIAEVNQRGRKHFRQYSSIRAGAEQLRQTNPRLDAELALHLARSGMKQSSAGKWVWKFDPLHRTTAPQPFYAAQAIEFLRRIACPVLIVDGAESRQTRRHDSKQRLEEIRDRKQVVIENAGHMVHQDNPLALAKVVAEFLS
ncbi:MAG TPA: alpha/beta hydrolase, partial [Candidatus Acidoferrales bacterium]|nr:alpha/beta hydrolase [Candidatus Acidoferrales bacterium]